MSERFIMFVTSLALSLAVCIPLDMFLFAVLP